MLDIIILLFLTALISPLFLQITKGRFSALLTLNPLAGFLYFLSQGQKIQSGMTLKTDFPWFSDMGVTLSFYLDGLSFLFAILITGIGVAIFFYSSGYLKKHPQLGRFFAYLFFFTGSMLGLVLADNLITLFIFWELTSLSSYLLISFDNGRQAARESALTALLVTAIGGLALLISFLLMASATHTMTLSTMLKDPALIQKSPDYLPMLILLLLGAFTKSAQFPFHFWLPRAMEAPTPVSAYLHSSTMVQAGVYLLARVHPLFSGTTTWFVTLTMIGSITMFGGILLAIKETDLKLILAYTTVSALGSLVYMLASNQPMVINACVAFIFVHALYKAPLFLAAGNIQHATGSRELNHAHGLFSKMPATLITMLIAGASMAGLPPLLGFYVKELVYEAKLLAPLEADLLILLVVLTNAGLVLLSLLLIIKPFFGEKAPKRAHEAPFSMWLSGVSLSLMMLLLSLFPSLIDGPLLAPAAGAILGRAASLRFTLWHGFSTSVSLSLITFLVGILLYSNRNKVIDTISYLKKISFLWPEVLYGRLMQGLIYFAKLQTHVIQNGRLPIYLSITLLTVTLILGFGLLHTPLSLSNANIPFSWFSIILLLALVLTAIAAALAKELIVAIIFLGAFGIAVALFFLVNAAPDVAMTQILVDTLFVVIFALSLYKFPSLPILERHTQNPYSLYLKLTIAISLGAIIACLLLAVINAPFHPVVSNYFAENSVLLGMGRNVVNVILVDFRAFDTLGETIVIIIAAIGVYGLIRKKTTRSVL